MYYSVLFLSCLSPCLPPQSAVNWYIFLKGYWCWFVEMCAVQCNGPAFYCLPHTNPRAGGVKWHLRGAVCTNVCVCMWEGVQHTHMKVLPLKMIKEITALCFTSLFSCLARCRIHLCTHTITHARTHAHIHTHLCVHQLTSVNRFLEIHSVYIST